MNDFNAMKFLMRFGALLAIIGFIGVLFYAYVSEITFDPPGARAPFIETVGTGAATNAVGDEARAASTLPLEKRHLTDKEVSDFLTTVISESLTIPPGQTDSVMAQVRGYYTDEGYRDFKAYLDRTGLLPQIVGGQYALGVVVDSMPVQANSGAVDGIYRWLYQVPITLNLRQGRAAIGDATTQPARVQVQVRRIENEADPFAIAIEDWGVKARRD